MLVGYNTPCQVRFGTREFAFFCESSVRFFSGSVDFGLSTGVVRNVDFLRIAYTYGLGNNSSLNFFVFSVVYRSFKPVVCIWRWNFLLRMWPLADTCFISTVVTFQWWVKLLTYHPLSGFTLIRMLKFQCSPLLLLDWQGTLSPLYCASGWSHLFNTTLVADVVVYLAIPIFPGVEVVRIEFRLKERLVRRHIHRFLGSFFTRSWRGTDDTFEDYSDLRALCDIYLFPWFFLFPRGYIKWEGNNLQPLLNRDILLCAHRFSPSS